MKKSIWLKLILAFVLLSVIGCNGNNDSKTTGEDEKSISSKEAEKRLIIAQSADVSALDPQLSNELASVSAYGNIFDTVVAMDKNQNIIPCIAESWKKNDDTTLTFNIRKGIFFSNGDKLTAADVVFSIERVIKSPNVSYTLDFIDYVEKIDDYTVSVHTKKPFGPILAHFTIPYTAIVPQKAVEADEAAFSKHPIGSGPYKLVEWKPGDSISLEANENYFQGAPNIKNITIKIMPENSQRLIALETGEIDIAYDISPNDISKIKKNEKLKVINEESMSCMFLTVNVKKGPLADINVRKAMEAAIEKQAIIDAVAYGHGAPAAIVIPPKAIGFSDKIKPIKYDLEEAKKYLAMSAYPKGFTCSLWTSDDSIRIEACNIIQNQLAQIGITANVEVLEYGALLSKLNEGKHDLIYERWTTDSCDAYYTLYGMYHSSCTAYQGNDAFYRSKKVDNLIATARTRFETTDRLKVYENVYKVISDETPYIMTYYPYTTIGMKSNVKGFVINPNGAHQLRLLSIL